MTNRERPSRPKRVLPDESTLIEEFEAHPRGAQEMAAARLAHDVTDLLNRALSQTGLQQAEWAKIVGVTPGRVSQVLADGNLRVSSIAKYARALGFQPQLSFEPVEAGRVAITAGARVSVPLRIHATEWRSLPRTLREPVSPSVNIPLSGFKFKSLPSVHTLGSSVPAVDLPPRHLRLIA